jgi:hypothetical protein
MGFLRLGRLPASTVFDPLLTKRNVINIGFLSQFQYLLINHYLSGDASTGPVGSGYASTTKTWMQMVDDQGWPQDPEADGIQFGGSIRVPSSDDFSGNYVIDWEGDGEVVFNAGTWTVNAGLSSNYSEISNGRYSNTTGSNPRIVVALSDLSEPSLIGVRFNRTDTAGAGLRYLKNFRFFREEDEARLDDGKTFRAPSLQNYVNLNPGAIRFMDWLGCNSDVNCRWGNRSKPDAAGFNARTNWVASPPYGDATFSTANQYTVSAVSTGSRQTPASMMHGEIATIRFASGKSAVRNGAKDITAIANNSAGTVTCPGHGFSNGDIILHKIPTGNGMQQMNLRAVAISNVSTDAYDTINTSAFDAFTGTAAGGAMQFVTLKVGSGNDRDAYPMMFDTARFHASEFGDGYLVAGDYKTFYFDKSIYGYRNSSGDPVYGVWLFQEGQNNAHYGDVPVEICTALVNEVNELSLAQGITTPVHMWMNIPHWGLRPMDDDYDIESDWAINAVETVLNGANGYAGLTSRASLIVEDSNETWNSGSAFHQTYYLAVRGFQRWPSTSNLNDYASMSMLRGVDMIRAVKAEFPGHPRIKYTLAGQGGAGYDVGNQNGARCLGTDSYLNDTLVTSGSWGTPISNVDAYAHACYFDGVDEAHSTYMSGSAAGSFTDDSNLYHGTGPYTGAADPDQAIENYLAVMVSGSGNQTVDKFCDPDSPSAGYDADFSVAMTAFGVKSIFYEGGHDWPVKDGYITWGSHTMTAADQEFTTAVINSSQWATAITAYYTATMGLANTALPGGYFVVADGNGQGSPDQRWAWASPDTYDSTAGVEGITSPGWVAMGVRNRALSV